MKAKRMITSTIVFVGLMMGAFILGCFFDVFLQRDSRKTDQEIIRIQSDTIRIQRQSLDLLENRCKLSQKFN
jgi:hypothetical protein